MRIKALMLTLILMLPGCLSEDEEITFHGRDLGGSVKRAAFVRGVVVE